MGMVWVVVVRVMLVRVGCLGEGWLRRMGGRTLGLAVSSTMSCEVMKANERVCCGSCWVIGD